MAARIDTHNGAFAQSAYPITNGATNAIIKNSANLDVWIADSASGGHTIPLSPEESLAILHVTGSKGGGSSTI